jgi:helix-turn-helix protein
MGGMTDGAGESPAAPPQPTKASTPAEFTSALRALRTWSGLTYRQLEGKAATYRDALPASTIATTLGRATLPRERFVDAFTRACGLAEDEVRQWLGVRRLISMGDPAAPEEPPDEEPPVSPRWRRFAPLVAVAVVGVSIGVAGTLGFDDSSAGAPPTATDSLPRMPIAGLGMKAVGAWAAIHPVGTPSLCVTEGLDTTRQYDSPVAAQMSCAGTPLPHVYLEPVAQNVVMIQWHNPEYGVGCLTVLSNGPARNLLEPWEDCAEGNPAQRFRLEMARDGQYRIHAEVTGQCLGARGPVAENTEVAQAACSGASEQNYLIELLNPPG